MSTRKPAETIDAEHEHVHGPDCQHQHDGHDHHHHAHALQPMRRVSPKIGRNDPCRCGSGKKFKKCHGANE